MGILIKQDHSGKWVLFIIVIVITFFGLLVTITNKFETKKNKKYPLANKNGSFSGRIEKVQLNRGTIYIALTNQTRFRTTASRNYNYDPYYIDDFLNYGDSIVKPLNTDTLCVFRDEKEYYFVLGKFINQ